MFCSELNVMDLSSGGCSGEALLKNNEWFHDPNFLKGKKENWPQPLGCNSTESEIALTETIKRSDKPTVHSLPAVEKGYRLKGIGKVVDCHRYSSKTKFLCVTANVLRFMFNLYLNPNLNHNLTAIASNP